MNHILSIDGGGIRGALTTCALVELERQTGKLCRDVFSFAAGTSTGALIAAAVAAGIPAKHILEIYTRRAGEIFNHSPAVAWTLRLTRGYAFDPANIRRVLESEFGAAAKWTLNDAPIKVLLTATTMDKRPVYFVTDNHHNAKTTGKLPLIDCAVASAAATTYIDSWKVPGWDGDLYDGGVTGILGNPCHYAAVEAFWYDDYKTVDTRMVSLGTGYYPAGKSKPVGLLNELFWVLDTALSVPEDEQVRLVQRYYPGVLMRMNWPLPQAVDMADVSAIPDLVRLGQQVAAGTDWEKLLS